MPQISRPGACSPSERASVLPTKPQMPVISTFMKALLNQTPLSNGTMVNQTRRLRSKKRNTKFQCCSVIWKLHSQTMQKFRIRLPHEIGAHTDLLLVLGLGT